MPIPTTLQIRCTVEFLEKINLPVYCSYATPKDIVGNWKVTNFGKPIVIDGVKIVTGDYLLADADGIVIIPKIIIQKVIPFSISLIITPTAPIVTSILRKV